MSQQLQTDKNISGKALDYKERAAKTLQSSKTDDDAVEKQRKHFIYAIPSCSPEHLAAKEGSPQRNFHLLGERTAGEPQQALSAVDICSLC